MNLTSSPKEFELLETVIQSFEANKREVLFVLHQQGLVNDKGKATKKALNDGFVKKLDNQDGTKKTVWHTHKTFQLFVLAGFKQKESFFAKAETMTYNIASIFKEADRYTQHNQHASAMCELREAVWQIDNAVRTTPKLDAVEVVATLCQALKRRGVSVTHIAYLFEHTRSGVTKEEVREYLLLQERDGMLKELGLESDCVEIYGKGCGRGLGLGKKM